MRYKILLVSAGQPSLNPRLVKEADTLAQNGYDVTVIYSYWNAWGTELDKALIAGKKWKAICAGGNPQSKWLTYFISRLMFKAATLFTRLTSSMLLAKIAIARSSTFLIREAKKHQANIYIGHNLGALPAVVIAAKKHGKPCAFDAEDFHRNEVTDDVNSIDVKIKTHIEDRYIPHLQYLTSSSPLIGEQYYRLYPQVKKEVILNTFPKTIIAQSVKDHVVIKLFWFSQTVGLNRGLESTIEALQQVQHTFELHLLGDVADEIRHLFTAQMAHTASTIHFHSPIPSNKIIEFAAQFDIGIAAENNIPFNRDICLTNKLFTYIQAGLPILASSTKAQTAFIQQYAVAGKLYPNNNVASIAEALIFYQNNRQSLMQDKAHNYSLGQTTLNWGTDQERLLTLVKETLPA
ncbi:MAG: glycosyltransferase [Bacteroidota bacterium]